MNESPAPIRIFRAAETRPSPPPGHGRGSARRVPSALCALAVALLAGCATPVGTTRVGVRDTYRQSTVNVLNELEPSYDTKVVLHRYGMRARFVEDPEGALAALHERALKADDRRDLRFALAELCFLHASELSQSSFVLRQRRAPDYFLMSAAYAALYLFGDSPEELPGAYGRRFRIACDLYDRGLGRGLATGKDGRVELKNGVRELPVGRVAVTVKADGLPWPLDSFEEFLSADDYAVRGLTVRNNAPGLGAPLIAVPRRGGEAPARLPVPLTAVLRFSGKRTGDLAKGTATATIELHSAYEEAPLQVLGKPVPMETDITAPLAYGLDDPDIWRAGPLRFLGFEKPVTPGLTPVQPFEPGRIPVVFVHGTASSPVWWAEMFNTLKADPLLRNRFQFWFFRYNSSAPIVLSASQLRDSLTEEVKKLDPEGKDAALRQMVVIGHSQGGLLTKMTAVSTGDRFWRSISDKPVDELNAKPEVKELIRRLTVLEPLPYVQRVVFISTPHRGSYRAKGWVRTLVHKLVTLPANIVAGANELVTLQDQVKLPGDIKRRIPTSVDGMSPTNPALLALAAIPAAPGIKAHSIIAVMGDGDIQTGNDGVVEYKSAHLDWVESEYIVRDQHSCQGNPLTIEEVRRILLEHLGAAAGAEPGQTPGRN